MKPVFGMLLIGGGAFLLIALFSGKFNLGGNFGFPSNLIDVINPYAPGGSKFTGLQMNPPSGHNVTGRAFTQPDPNGNCPSGFYPSLLAGGKKICLQGPPPK
jgi:hypothetical protein